MSRKRAMSWWNFERIYGPLEVAPDGSDFFQTFDYPIVKDFPLKRVWSVVEAEDSMYVIPGFHVVNMQGYIVTTKPWGDYEEADLWAKW